MSSIDFAELTRYAKTFTGLTADKEVLLRELGPAMTPRLGEVTERFYQTLQGIPKAESFLEGRLEHLKATHRKWLEGLFAGPYDETYTKGMYHVGSVHVSVKLPVEFMSGGTTLIQGEMLPVVKDVCEGDAERMAQAMAAINAVLGFSLLVMQESFQSGTLAKELDKFLAISGMSRKLFDNLAAAYGD